MVEWRIVISREGLIALLAAKSQNSVEVFHKSKAPAAAALHLCLCTCAKKKKKKRPFKPTLPYTHQCSTSLSTFKEQPS